MGPKCTWVCVCVGVWKPLPGISSFAAPPRKIKGPPYGPESLSFCLCSTFFHLSFLLFFLFNLFFDVICSCEFLQGTIGSVKSHSQFLLAVSLWSPLFHWTHRSDRVQASSLTTEPQCAKTQPRVPWWMQFQPSPWRPRCRKLNAGSDRVRWREGPAVQHFSHEFHIISGTLEVLKWKHTHNAHTHMRAVFPHILETDQNLWMKTFFFTFGQH